MTGVQTCALPILGAKYLHKYLNQYKAADEDSKDIAKRLIRLEEQLVSDIRQYL